MAALAMVAALTLVPMPAMAITTQVDMNHPVFDPAGITVTQGAGVNWNNVDSFPHTSTGNGPLLLWNSGNVAGGGDFSRVFSFAGKYAYHCSIHSEMTGTVSVPIQVSPMSGSMSTTFTITVGSTAPTAPFRMIVQIKKPGKDWQAWRTITTASTTFHPARTGAFRFRAQIQRISNGAKSGMSPARAITVTSGS